MQLKSAFWIRIALLNLLIVAFLGTLMRYKIGFAFPYFDQKFIQEAHSHFAFTGWITHTLYILLIILFRNNLAAINEKMYRSLIIVNLVSAYGMLVAFFIQGYGPVSIFFATLSLIVGYVFSYFALKDAGRLPVGHPSKNWIRAAIWFSIFSTIGTMVLSYMMASKEFDQTTYLGSIYFYLHFQYNGWFLFACIALFMDRFKRYDMNPKLVRRTFWLFFLPGVPTYFLSTLWVAIPIWLYIIVILASIAQVIGWWYFVQMIRTNFDHLKSLFTRMTLRLFLIVGLALTLKLVLQMASTIPAVSKLAFGFRPIVIAYLHLVLLVIISIFLLAFMYGTNLLAQRRNLRIAIIIFVIGAILNETVLAIQGIFAFSYTVVPLANEALFVVALILFFGALLLFLAHWKSAKH